MAAANPQPPLIQFGPFELDVQSGELRKHGIRLKLQRQPLQILAILLERPGEVVTREEIQKRLWADNTYVDFDNAINSAMRKLRDALGDAAENPHFIETLARRGYRFIYPMAADVRVAKVELPKVTRRLHRVLWIAVPLIVALAVVAGFRIARPKREVVGNPGPPLPVTSYEGFQLFPSLSPEGTRVAFSWSEPGKRPSNIYVKMIGPGEPVRLTANPNGDFAPAWSPDARFIAFLRKRDSNYASVMVIPALGGHERELTHLRIDVDVEMTLPAWEWGVPPPLLAWSPDAKWLVTLDKALPDGAYHLARISVETGEKRSLTFPPPTIFGDGSVALSPDGKTLAFSRTVTYSVSDVYVLPLSREMLTAGQPRRLTFDNKEIAGLAWSSDGQGLVFPSARGGRLEMWRASVNSSSAPVKLAVTGDDPFDPAISSRANRLVYSHKFGYENIWRVSLHGKNAGEAANLIPSTREEGHPRYSPDGKRIAFEASFSGSEEIWVANEDGTSPVQLTFLGAWAGSPRWSPDGRKIVFDSNVTGNWDIYVVDSQGGKPTRLASSAADDIRPSWSHDNKSIYFSSNRTGSYQIWRIPATGGTQVQLTNNGGTVAFESDDGGTLYYTRDDGIWGMPLAGGSEYQLPISISHDNFALARQGLYFIDGDDVHLKLFDFKTHKTRTIATVPGAVGDEMSVSPDGHSMIYEKTTHAGSELMLVENFR